MRSLQAVRRKLFAMMILGMATLCFAGPALSAIIVVDRNGGGHYLTIAEGINAAAVGDTVKALAGVYEEAVFINQNITLIGEGPDATTVRNPGGVAISIAANINCRNSGLTVTGSLDGFAVGDSDDVKIENNLIVGNDRHGIKIYSSSRPSPTISIVNNTIIVNGRDGAREKQGSGLEL